MPIPHSTDSDKGDIIRLGARIDLVERDLEHITELISERLESQVKATEAINAEMRKCLESFKEGSEKLTKGEFEFKLVNKAILENKEALDTHINGKDNPHILNKKYVYFAFTGLTSTLLVVCYNKPELIIKLLTKLLGKLI